jgi:hypothetical protein
VTTASGRLYFPSGIKEICVRVDWGRGLIGCAPLWFAVPTRASRAPAQPRARADQIQPLQGVTRPMARPNRSPSHRSHGSSVWGPRQWGSSRIRPELQNAGQQPHEGGTCASHRFCHMGLHRWQAVIQHHPRAVLRPVGGTDYRLVVHDQHQQLSLYLWQ